MTQQKSLGQLLKVVLTIWIAIFHNLFAHTTIWSSYKVSRGLLRVLRTINKLESQKHFQKIAKKLAAEHNNNQQNHDFNKLDSMNIHDNMNIFLTEFIGKVLKKSFYGSVLFEQ